MISQSNGIYECVFLCGWFDKRSRKIYIFSVKFSRICCGRLIGSWVYDVQSWVTALVYITYSCEWLWFRSAATGRSNVAVDVLVPRNWMKWALIILAFTAVIGIVIGIAVYASSNSEPGNTIIVQNLRVHPAPPIISANFSVPGPPLMYCLSSSCIWIEDVLQWCELCQDFAALPVKLRFLVLLFSK